MEDPNDTSNQQAPVGAKDAVPSSLPAEKANSGPDGGDQPVPDTAPKSAGADDGTTAGGEAAVTDVVPAADDKASGKADEAPQAEGKADEAPKAEGKADEAPKAEGKPERRRSRSRSRRDRDRDR
eukprot:360993-Chlamydomonas_euryale.AAC.1